LLEANAGVTWTPEYMGKRMDDWLQNMNDWHISRRRYYGLPLPFYPCPCGHLNVIGSRRELEERAVTGLDQLEELHRPWIDAVRIRCESCGENVARIPEVGDVWLDAGIVPFRTVLGYEKMLDERGREMHGSWGNLIQAEDAFARMGADVMRWQFCSQPPDQDLFFGYGPGHEIKRRLLTLWNSVSFFVEYANIRGFEPHYSDLTDDGDDLPPLDRWLVARTRRLVQE